MRILLTLLALMPAVADVAAAPARIARPGNELRLVFLGDERAPVHQGASDDATIDVGRVVAAKCPTRGCMRTLVRKQFRLRVDGNATTTRFARTRAYLQHEVPGHRVRVDGRLLTTTPQIIDAAIPLGAPVSHTLEIQIPINEPEGALNESIVWLVETAG